MWIIGLSLICLLVKLLLVFAVAGMLTVATTTVSGEQESCGIEVSYAVIREPIQSEQSELHFSDVGGGVGYKFARAPYLGEDGFRIG